MMKKYKVKCRVKVSDSVYETETKLFWFYRRAVKEYEQRIKDEATQYVVIDKYNPDSRRFDLPVQKWIKSCYIEK